MKWEGTYSLRLTPVSYEDMLPFMSEEDKAAIKKDPPAAPPAHKLTLGENGGIPYAIYETEHGKQIVGNLCYTGPVIRFTALAGTPGDEFFIYAVELKDGKLTGESYQPGKPHSKLEGERLD